MADERRVGGHFARLRADETGQGWTVSEPMLRDHLVDFMFRNGRAALVLFAGKRCPNSATNGLPHHSLGTSPVSLVSRACEHVEAFQPFLCENMQGLLEPVGLSFRGTTHGHSAFASMKFRVFRKCRCFVRFLDVS